MEEEQKMIQDRLIKDKNDKVIREIFEEFKVKDDNKL